MMRSKNGVSLGQSSQRKIGMGPPAILGLELKGSPMNDHILKAIDEEIERLRRARNLLGNPGKGTIRKMAGKSAFATGSQPKPRRKLSAKARQAIAEAQRRRWARVNAQKKSTAPAAEK